jgi:hypothetical protein
MMLETFDTQGGGNKLCGISHFAKEGCYSLYLRNWPIKDASTLVLSL